MLSSLSCMSSMILTFFLISAGEKPDKAAKVEMSCPSSTTQRKQNSALAYGDQSVFP